MTHSRLRNKHLVTASLLHSFGGTSSILDHLDDEEKEPLLDSMNLLSGGDPFQLNVALEHIHFSWLIPLISEFAKPLQVVFGNCLNPENKKGLMEHLEIPIDLNNSPHQVLRKFLLRYLDSRLRPDTVRSLYLLAPSSLKPLLTTKPRILYKWIHYLGLQDLALEIPQIIDKTILKNIYSFLTEKEKLSVKKYLHKSDDLKLPPLNLRFWNGDKVELRSLIHKRGLKRFAHALQGQSDDFMWHLIHHFDVGRGSILKQLHTTPIDDNIANKLKETLIEMMKSE